MTANLLNLDVSGFFKKMCASDRLGRGIDQIFTHPSEATIHEAYIKDARNYVKIAENMNGNIPLVATFRRSFLAMFPDTLLPVAYESI